MATTALQLVQAAATEIGITAPASIVGTGDLTSLQLLALLNRFGESLLTEKAWQDLTKLNLITTQSLTFTCSGSAGALSITCVAGFSGLTSDFAVTGNGFANNTRIVSVSGTTATIDRPLKSAISNLAITFSKVAYPMPSDFDRMITDTHYDKTSYWPMYGVRTAQEWQRLKSGIQITGVRYAYRILADKLEIFPSPAANLTLGFEYVSKYWVSDSLGNGKAKVDADSDTCVFPDKLMVMGTKLLWWQIKGYDSSILERDLYREVAKYVANEAGGRTVSMGVQLSADFINVPQSGFGQ